jgi:predicted RNase H-related nuclease YkuK (DUF458 family)
MERYFKTEEGKLVNLIEHTIEQIEKRPDLKIYIATDSQNYGYKSVYVTAIVYRYGIRGAHYIYHKQRIPRIQDIFSRLWKEAEFTIETATFLKENMPIQIEALEFDFNNKQITKSTPLVKSIKGWAESLGIKANMKPDEMIAAKAADHLCRA